MKFLDYEASYITPQKTLLKKFNEILKFLEKSNVNSLYIHKISIEFTNIETATNLGILYFISSDEEAYDYKTIDLFLLKGFLCGKTLFIGSDAPSKVLLITNLIRFPNTSYISTSAYDLYNGEDYSLAKFIIHDEVEEF